MGRTSKVTDRWWPAVFPRSTLRFRDGTLQESECRKHSAADTCQGALGELRASWSRLFSEARTLWRAPSRVPLFGGSLSRGFSAPPSARPFVPFQRNPFSDFKPRNAQTVSSAEELSRSCRGESGRGIDTPYPKPRPHLNSLPQLSSVRRGFPVCALRYLVG